MPHNPRKKRTSNERKSQRSSVPEQQSPVSEHAPEYTAHDRQRSVSQIPFYDDSNHLAYGWQQMTALPDVYNVVRSTQNDPPMSPQSRSQTWPVEQQGGDEKDEPSGFSPHPGRGQGPRRPRRPRPLTESESRRKFKPFVDSVTAEQEDAVAGADSLRGRPASSALTSKDVNQKMQVDRNQASPSLKLTESRRERSRPRSQKLIVDELESPQQADRGAERMAPLPEEPAPLRVRKKRADKSNAEARSRPSTLEQARMLRAEQERGGFVVTEGGIGIGVWTSDKFGTGQDASTDSSHGRKGVMVIVHEVNGAENDGMEGLMAAITEQLSAFTVQPDPHFEHRSAVPKPLDLGAIEAAKEKRRLARMETELRGDARGNVKGREEIGSVESFATGTSSEFKTLSVPDSSERNGARRKWYKGFRRSE